MKIVWYLRRWNFNGGKILLPLCCCKHKHPMSCRRSAGCTNTRCLAVEVPGAQTPDVLPEKRRVHEHPMSCRRSAGCTNTRCLAGEAPGAQTPDVLPEKRWVHVFYKLILALLCNWMWLVVMTNVWWLLCHHPGDCRWTLVNRFHHPGDCRWTLVNRCHHPADCRWTLVNRCHHPADCRWTLVNRYHHPGDCRWTLVNRCMPSPCWLQVNTRE